MNVKELKSILNSCNDEADIVIYGCYGSYGRIEKAYIAKEENHKKEEINFLVIESDICSG